MVEVKRSAFESFMGPIAEGHFDVKVSLFVVSKTNPRLKHIDLAHLSAEERAKKLHKWALEHRFVAVVEIGDMCFAHTHAHHAEHLQKINELSLNGKKVTVQALTEDQVEQLDAIAEDFDENVLSLDEEKKEAKEQKANQSATHYIPNQSRSGSRLVKGKEHTHLLIEQMVKRGLGKIIARCMEKYSEAQREERKRKEADDKYFDIKRSEIKKEILKEEIKKDEITKQNRLDAVVRNDDPRIDRTVE